MYLSMKKTLLNYYECKLNINIKSKLIAHMHNIHTIYCRNSEHEILAIVSFSL